MGPAEHAVLVVDERDASKRRTIRLTSSKPLTARAITKRYAKFAGEAVDGFRLARPGGGVLAADDAPDATVFVVARSSPRLAPPPATAAATAAPARPAAEATPRAAPRAISLARLRYDERVMDRVHVGNLMRHALELGALVAPVALNATMENRPDGECWVLDVGSGLGEPACTIATHDRAARVVGIDIHPPYVNASNRRAASLGMAATFEILDGCAADFEAKVRAAAARLSRGLPASGFHLVTSTLVVPFFADLDRGLRNMRRVAREGAALVLAMWDGNPPLEPVMAKMIELVGLKKRKTTKDLAVATLVAALPRCGWRDPKSAPATTHYRWDCLDDCWQWILHHSPAGFKETATDDQLRGGRAYIEAYVRGRSPPGWAEGDAIAVEVPITVVHATAG